MSSKKTEEQTTDHAMHRTIGTPGGKVAAEAAREKQCSCGDKIDEKSGSPKTDASSEAERLQKDLEARTREAEEYREEAARAKADFYNYRTRVERDRARDRILAAEGTVDALLPVLDNLDRSLTAVTDKDSALYKGVAMVQKQFFAALQTLGLQPIDTNGAFDPAQHEAVMVVAVDDAGQDGKILEELHRGYMLGDKVLRAAQVKVGRKE